MSGSQPSWLSFGKAHDVNSPVEDLRGDMRNPLIVAEVLATCGMAVFVMIAPQLQIPSTARPCVATLIVVAGLIVARALWYGTQIERQRITSLTFGLNQNPKTAFTPEGQRLLERKRAFLGRGALAMVALACILAFWCKA